MGRGGEVRGKVGRVVRLGLRGREILERWGGEGRLGERWGGEVKGEVGAQRKRRVWWREGLR